MRETLTLNQAGLTASFIIFIANLFKPPITKQGMHGIVVQFRRGRSTIHERHYLLDFGLTSRDEAKKMAGKEVIWKSSAGKEIRGKISDAHGNKGIVRAIFERGLPGQAMTTDVEILEHAGKGGKK